MKKIVIYASAHHRNTEKIAKIIADTIGAKLISFDKLKSDDIDSADLIGIGSGVYYSLFHRGLINKIKDLNNFKDKEVFIFSTAGMAKNTIFNNSHQHIKKLLKNKEAKILGEFFSYGYDTNGILKFLGGINKGRPNESDLKRAEDFSKKILENKKTNI